jgi:folate-binding protein YgfZ
VSTLNELCDCDDLGVLSVRGMDAVKFLQGQLSQDVAQLDARRPRFAGLHTPQGRVIAILQLLPGAEGAIHCILPRELIDTVAATLRRYILRAKVTLADDSGSLFVIGAASGGVRTLGVAGARAGAAATLTREAWRALDIAAGLPQVYAATSGEFVAQMLNLDCVGGIAFDKGCYTGQEIIVRAHYRGRVKRRMQPFRTRRPVAAAPVPGESGTLADGRTFRVVAGTLLEDGRAAFLAVAALEADPAAAVAGGEAWDVERLPLPYALPD